MLIYASEYAYGIWFGFHFLLYTVLTLCVLPGGGLGSLCLHKYLTLPLQFKVDFLLLYRAFLSRCFYHVPERSKCDGNQKTCVQDAEDVSRSQCIFVKCINRWSKYSMGKP